MVDSKFIKHCNDFDNFLKKSKKDFEERWTAKFQPNAKLDDFEMVRTLGTGSFGRVTLVKHNAMGSKIYAMKIMEKAHLVKLKQVSHVISEIRIMDALKFEFLVNMEFFFKGNVYLYLVMPFVNGGEMFSHLRMQRRFDETLAKFYAAQIILAFEYMHNLGVVYRDLKPENILLDSDGYLKITDYGFCKKIDNNRTYTLCGTPEYLAPEIILNQGYNRSVDWWATGVLIYEISAGYPPFFAKDPLQIYEKIVAGSFICPAHFSKPLKNLVTSIIQVDRSKRLGMLQNGAKDLKRHEWFNPVDWDAILHRKVKPSLLPTIIDPDDATNFDEYDEKELRESDIDEFAEEFADLSVTKQKEKKD